MLFIFISMKAATNTSIIRKRFTIHNKGRRKEEPREEKFNFNTCKHTLVQFSKVSFKVSIQFHLLELHTKWEEHTKREKLKSFLLLYFVIQWTVRISFVLFFHIFCFCFLFLVGKSLYVGACMYVSKIWGKIQLQWREIE